jgi:hypothetical protein
LYVLSVLSNFLRILNGTQFLRAFVWLNLFFEKIISKSSNLTLNFVKSSVLKNGRKNLRPRTVAVFFKLLMKYQLTLCVKIRGLKFLVCSQQFGKVHQFYGFLPSFYAQRTFHE